MSKRNPFRSHQRVMIILAWLVAIGLLYLLFKPVIEAQLNPNQKPMVRHTAAGSTEVVLLANGHHAYVFTGKINGQKVNFLVDTGATSVSIPAKVAARLQLSKGQPYPVRTANGRVTVYHTTLDSLSIGDIQLRHVSANINPGLQGQQILLGMSAMKHLELIKRDHTLIIRQQ